MAILDLLFPKRCVRCGQIGAYVCIRCLSGVIPVRSTDMICPMCEKPAIDGIVHPRCRTKYGLDGLYAFFYYQNTIPYVIKALKYRAVSDSVETCAELALSSGKTVSDLFRVTRADHAVCMPIPLHPTRLHMRGFNQSELLGRSIMQKLHIPIDADILYRTLYTVPQVEMKDRDERLKNMKHVFGARTGIMPPHVLLFDDVWTTGATMRAAANVLKRHGAKYVWAVAFAR